MELELLSLPDDVLFEIFCRLHDDERNVAALARTCRRMADMARMEALFARLLGARDPRLVGDAFCTLLPLLPPHPTQEEREEEEEKEETVLMPQTIRQRYEAVCRGMRNRKCFFHFHDALFEGDYGPHGKEYVYVTRRGYLLQGLKITGDPNVPRGVVSFEVLLSADGMYGMGKICLADDQFRNQHFGRCQLLPHSSHSFFKVWFYQHDHATADYERITVENMRSGELGPITPLPTRFVRCQDGLKERIDALIANLPKDALGNVNNAELERLLG